MNAELAKNLRERAAEDYPEGSLQKYIESSTYVNLRDCMLFQKKGRDESVDVVVRRRHLTVVFGAILYVDNQRIMEKETVAMMYIGMIVVRAILYLNFMRNLIN